ncbi:MAG TPA: ABC transporter permease [Bacteroidales bacterium]|nr:ABC transporter permease [Bacteroidales bacterium]
MIRNFFLTVFRNTWQNKFATAINVVGLATGLAASLLILLWVRNELSFEKFLKDAGNIYRVEEDQFYSGEKYHVTVTPFPSGPEWKEKIPEVKDQVRINRLARILFRKDDKAFFESSLIAADSTFFNVFSFEMILGNPRTALNDPYSVVLTQKLANKYFGDEDPLGKTLTLENSLQCKVTGVVRNLPNNTIFTFEGILPYSLQRALNVPMSTSWGNNSIFTYLLLNDGIDIASVNKKLTDVVLEHNPETTIKFVLFPHTGIHLHQQFGFTESNKAVTTVYIFTLIGIFILLIACINFINLSTARSSIRAKEIGIKKAAGASRFAVFMQFMLESLLFVTISMAIALVIMGLLLNKFNEISGRHFSLDDLASLKFAGGIIATGLVAGILSGIYPAVYLSSFNPAAVLKGETSSAGKGRLRQSLVIVQFSLSIVIAITAVFMFRQLRFLQEKDLGFNKENLICIPLAQNMKPKYGTLRKELKNESLIMGVTAASSNPVLIGSNSGGAWWEGKDPQQTVLIGLNGVDYDYTSTLQMKMISGRDFSADFSGDFAQDTTGNFIVNEEVARIMNSDDPVGKPFRFMGLRGTIVGVMKNFHFRDPDQPVGPVAFALTDTRRLYFVLVRLAGDTKDALKAVEKVWSNVLPDYPLEYTFVDQDYDNLFRAEKRLTELLKYFTILAVIIACLGLYGLSLYSAQRRTNEVGIRKVMGAGSLPIVYAMSKEFVTLVFISILIAVPAGWYIVKKLLQQFAYRIDVDLVVFLAIAAGAILIAFATVSFQAWKATGINPAVALKVE